MNDTDVCELHGHLWAADGVCRRCPETQPTAADRIAKLKQRLKEKADGN